jgi:hypothetical protein
VAAQGILMDSPVGTKHTLDSTRKIQLNTNSMVFSANHEVGSAGNPELGSSPRAAGSGLGWNS